MTAGSGQVQLPRSLDNELVQLLHKATSARIVELAGTRQLKIFVMVSIKKTRYTFMYRSMDGHYMRPESFLNINKGRTLSSSQLRALGITKVKLKDVCI